MKHPAFVLVAAFLVGTALSGCGKQQNEAETADTQTAPPANETAANASGTTTYYGSPDEQANN